MSHIVTIETEVRERPPDEFHSIASDPSDPSGHVSVMRGPRMKRQVICGQSMIENHNRRLGQSLPRLERAKLGILDHDSRILV